MTDDADGPLDLVWGCGEIARLIRRTPRQVQMLLDAGALPGAKKLNRRWCITRRNLFAAFESVTSESEVRR